VLRSSFGFGIQSSNTEEDDKDDHTVVANEQNSADVSSIAEVWLTLSVVSNVIIP
jgi:hypothetical protein